MLLSYEVEVNVTFPVQMKLDMMMAVLLHLTLKSYWNAGQHFIGFLEIVGVKSGIEALFPDPTSSLHHLAAQW